MDLARFPGKAAFYRDQEDCSQVHVLVPGLKEAQFRRESQSGFSKLPVIEKVELQVQRVKSRRMSAVDH